MVLILNPMVEFRTPYWPDIICEMVELHRALRDSEDLARAFEPTTQPSLAWIARADKKKSPQADAPPRSRAVHRDQSPRLRCENERVRAGRDILSKAVPWFGRETETLPSNSSGS